MALCVFFDKFLIDWVTSKQAVMDYSEFEGVIEVGSGSSSDDDATREEWHKVLQKKILNEFSKVWNLSLFLDNIFSQYSIWKWVGIGLKGNDCQNFTNIISKLGTFFQILWVKLILSGHYWVRILGRPLYDGKFWCWTSKSNSDILNF